MRTIAAGRVLACGAILAVVLMSACTVLGYRIAQHDAHVTYTARSAAAAGSIDVERPEGVAVVDRIGELSGRLTRLEIEAAALARRLGIAPPKKNGRPQARDASRTDDDSPRGGPLLPVGGETSLATAAAQQAVGDYGLGLDHLETEVALMQASLDRIAGVLADRELTTLAYPNRSPVQGRMPRISSGYGVRHDPFTGRLARHMGLDIPAMHGTAILASGGGRVISAGFRGPYGNAIVIDHGQGLQTLYGHCSKLYVRAGELVMPQQKIAAVGSTGRSTGPHLHFEVIRNGERVAPGQVLENVLARNAN
jgi:murein DD-endopeptidase MepM/ murein hydrolase activator NlpD